MRKNFFIPAVSLLAISLFVAVSPAEAATIDELKAKITVLQDQINQLTIQVARLQAGGAIPTINFLGQASSTLAKSSLDLYRFTITNSAQTKIQRLNFKIGKLDMNASLHNIAINNVGLYRLGALSPVGVVVASSTVATSTGTETSFEAIDLKIGRANGGTMDTINPGETITYILKATIGDSANLGDYVSTQLRDSSPIEKDAIRWLDANGKIFDSSSTVVPTAVQHITI